jgi:hypothetical protein
MMGSNVLTRTSLPVEMWELVATHLTIDDIEALNLVSTDFGVSRVRKWNAHILIQDVPRSSQAGLDFAEDLARRRPRPAHRLAQLPLVAHFPERNRRELAQKSPSLSESRSHSMQERSIPISVCDRQLRNRSPGSPPDAGLWDSPAPGNAVCGLYLSIRFHASRISRWWP